MQSRDDMMEELYEQMEAEGLSREEADAFMESVNNPPPAEHVDGPDGGGGGEAAPADDEGGAAEEL